MGCSPSTQAQAHHAAPMEAGQATVSETKSPDGICPVNPKSPGAGSAGAEANGVSDSGLEPRTLMDVNEDTAESSQATLPATIGDSTAIKEQESADEVGNDLESMKIMRPWSSGEHPGKSALKNSDSINRRGRVLFDVEQDEVHNVHAKKQRAIEISMKKIVDELYSHVLADNCLCPFYDNIDIQKLKHQQTKLMMYVFGGQDLVIDEDPNFDLRKIHLRLLRSEGLTEVHWAAFVKHFEEVVGSMVEIPQESRTKAINAIYQTKKYFVPLAPGE